MPFLQIAQRLLAVSRLRHQDELALAPQAHAADVRAGDHLVVHQHDAVLHGQSSFRSGRCSSTQVKRLDELKIWQVASGP